MKRTNESGRSMVEMLGVLAIIGVLSIGGIAGYSMAMNRYRANEVIDTASKYAVVVFAGAQTYVATGGGTAVANYTPPAPADMGLTVPTNAEITKNKIEDDGVTLNIKFQTEAVCKAGASILGVSVTAGTAGTDGSSGTPATCASNTITYKFKQS